MDNSVQGSVKWADSGRRLKELAGEIRSAETVVFDLETTGLDEHAWEGGPKNKGVGARIVLATFTLSPEKAGEGPRNWIVPLSHPESLLKGRWRQAASYLSRAMKETVGGLVGHNVKYDLRYIFATTGIDLTGRTVWDTMMSSRIIDENASAKLKERVPQVFEVERWDDVDLKYPGAAEDVPMKDLGRYAVQDTYWTWMLLEHHRGILNPEEVETPEDVELARLRKLATWVVMPTVASLARMEMRGIKLDRQWVENTLKEGEEIVREVSRKLATRYEGMDPEKASFAPTSRWFREWADKAVDQQDLVISALTRTGKPQWTKQVLSKLSGQGYEVATDLLRLRKYSKRNEFLRSWLGMTTKFDTIHTNYTPGGAISGRLSSSGPNMQQVNKELRQAFIPRRGRVIADLDYSQIEMRVAAHVSDCRPMIEAFQRGDDLHTTLAANIARKDQRDVTAMERQSAKAGNFGLLFGMGPEGFQSYAEAAYGVTLTYDESVRVHHMFFQTWEGIAEWHAKMVRKVHSRGQVSSPLGRVRRLPDVWDASDHVVARAERMSINAPVQGMASDLMQMSIAWIQGLLPGTEKVEGAHPVATVHDSVVIEADEDRWEEILTECKRRMIEVVKFAEKMDCQVEVPLDVEGVVGTRWGLSDVGTV